MTPTSGLKRLGLAGAVAVVAVIVAFAAMPLLVRVEAVRDAVETELRAATGLSPSFRGEVSISSFPWTSVGFGNIAMSSQSDGRLALRAEHLRAQLRLLPLLAGKVQVAEITLSRPQVVIDVDADGDSNWTGVVATIARSLTPEGRSERAPAFSEIRLVGGVVIIRSPSRGINETLSEVELSLAWPAISKSFGATGHFVWRGERVDASVSLTDFLAALSGERSGFKLRVGGAPLKLAFDGHVGYKPTLKVDGVLAADSASLRRALLWSGHEPLPGSGFERFSLKAQTSAVGSTLALSNVNVELDGNSAEGVLTLSGDQRPLIQGTLAANEIDLSPYVSGVRLKAPNDRDWNRVPIRLSGFAGLDFDLRLSASRVAIAGTKLGRTALGASLRGGRMTVTIGESQAFGGMLKGSIALARADAGADLKAQLQFTDVDLESCLSTVFGIRRLDGRGDMALMLEASGGDVAALARAISGSAGLTASRGGINGVNVEQMLRRLERRPLSGTGDFRNGRTQFDKLAISIKIAHGAATVESGTLDGSAVRLALGGSASIPTRDLDLKGIASLVPTIAKDNAAIFDLPFVVRGSWDDPVMLPDVQTLIRRSGAAGPLLDAVRDGRSRDAVRSAIDQLRRGPEPPETAASGGQAQSPVPAAPASAAQQ